MLAYMGLFFCVYTGIQRMPVIEEMLCISEMGA